MNKAVIEALEPRVLLSYVVTSLADDGSSGTLRYEIQQAEAAGTQTVTFSPSLTASGPATIDLNRSALTLDDTSGTLTIQGPAANLLTINAEGHSGVFVVDSNSDAQIDGLSITGGHGPTGSGIRSLGTLTVTNCIITGNSTSMSGGGIFSEYGPSLTVTNCIISGNSAASVAGGGIYDLETPVTVEDCTISGNSSASAGGIYIYYATMSVVDSVISGNSARSFGGGISDSGGNISVMNSTLSGNTAVLEGGGIYNRGTLSVVDSTIDGNTGGHEGGGGIFGTGTIEGSIIAQNIDGDLLVHGASFTGTYNLIGDGSGGLSASNNNILGTTSAPINPLLAPLSYYGGPTETIALLPGSPAFQTGSTFSGVSTDQRGISRPTTAPDIGAFQTQTAPLIVNTTADDPVGAGQLSLRDAINLADAMGGNQTITFASSLTAGGPATIDLNGTALTLDDISGTLAIQGPGSNSLAVSGQGHSGVLIVDAGSAASISGLTITAGHASTGAGIANHGTLTTSNSTISNNSATYGGGIENSGTVTITGSTISGNSVTRFGGGIQSYGQVSITGSTISGNSASGGGGGISSSNKPSDNLVVIDSTLSGNSTSGIGGAIQNARGTVTIVNSTLTGNIANRGGGLYNSTDAYYDSNIAITDSTLANNLAGGGIYNSGSRCKVTLSGTIVAGNAGGDLKGTTSTFSGTYNLIGDGSGSLSSSNGNILGSGSSPINPLLAPLGYYGGPTETMALLPGSQAIGKGSNFSGATTDQRGFARPSTATDIGAFQTQASALVVNTTADDPVGAAQLSLRDAINLADAMGGNQTITFASSLTASGPATIDLNGTALTLDDTSGSLTIQGPGSNLLTVNAQGHSGVFVVDPGASAAIEGLTITDGNSADGGIDNHGTLTINDCSISGNTATGSGSSGGGIYNSGTATISDSSITGNSAQQWGGGVLNRATLTVTDSIVSGNTASDGGGIYNLGSTLTVNNSTINDNSASGYGGGVQSGGTFTISDSTLDDNSGVWGGAIRRKDAIRSSPTPQSAVILLSGVAAFIMSFR